MDRCASATLLPTLGIGERHINVEGIWRHRQGHRLITLRVGERDLAVIQLTVFYSISNLNDGTYYIAGFLDEDENG
ncbi:MAG: hypothetical protein AAFX99_28780, partial [Myxococcota bacterium]